AFSAFMRALEHVAPEALVLFKPHPADKTNYILDGPCSVVTCDEQNINELICLSDVCVSLSTTSLARCIVEDKPILLLGLSEISMKGVAYEVHNESEIGAAIQAAIYRVDFEERKRKGHAFLRTLFNEYLVGVTDEVPTRLGVADLARYVVDRCMNYAASDKRGIRTCHISCRTTDIALLLSANDRPVRGAA